MAFKVCADTTFYSATKGWLDEKLTLVFSLFRTSTLDYPGDEICLYDFYRLILINYVLFNSIIISINYILSNDIFLMLMKICNQNV